MDIALLRQLPIFSSLPEDEMIDLLFSNTNALRKYEQGQFIKLRGDVVRGVCVLASGSIRGIMGNEEGREISVETHHAPALLASAFVFASNNHLPVHLEAMTDCEVLFISRERLLSAMQANQSFLVAFLQLVSDRGEFLSRRLREFAVMDLKSRVVAYYKEHGEIGNQSDLALHLGVARPSLTKAISELARDGVIIKKRNG